MSARSTDLDRKSPQLGGPKPRAHTPKDDAHLRSAFDALDFLAADPAAQIEVWCEVLSARERAIEAMLPALESKAFEASARAAMLRVSALLRRMLESGGVVWSDASIREGLVWGRLRGLAKKARVSVA